jgi:transcriptional regulator with XRE-family HTH domain
MRQMRPASRRFGEHGAGVMSPEVFEEMVLVIFETKREFAEFTGISVAQVQRYTSGVSPVPRSVALLVAALALLRRRQIPMPDLEELGVPPERLENDHFIMTAYEKKLAEVGLFRPPTERDPDAPEPPLRRRRRRRGG